MEKDFQCQVCAINGVMNHVHILFLLNPNFSVKDILKNIKGESSHWINQEDYSRSKFAWQTGYGAFSVSEGCVDEVCRYIINQKNHHQRKSFFDEYKELLEKHGFQELAETIKTYSMDVDEVSSFTDKSWELDRMVKKNIG